jgi:hypothetical protein
MSNTLRKDVDGKTYKESLKKKEARYKCHCDYCSGVSKNRLCKKIAEKGLKEEVRTIEQGEHLDFYIPEQDKILEQIFGRL